MAKKGALKKWADEFGHGAKTKLAKEAGITWPTAHDLVEGRRRPTPETARRVAAVTGLTVEELLYE